ncbi:AMP-binding protein [Sphingomonas sp. KC8]|uniref:AMP-binding protein n=1 Tax=Sphingomonas sp. KC8 TaxID=1030157 RepID=UPI000496FFA7|nr:AMP-binding protein [Sphingomonas sp. KC8]ARS26049.1 fatty-acid--CoA ligase [Sphingomonas sp. KC8]
MGISAAVARAAQVRPRHPATICGDRTRSWDEVASRVARIAGGLAAMGLGQGDRIAILGLNNDRYFELFLAGPHAGGVVVPLNSRWSQAELADGLDDCEPVILAADDAFLPLARLLATGRPGLHLLAIGEDHPADIAHHDDLVAHAAIADAGRTGDDLFGIFYTGGTTGRSKGVMLSHRNVLRGANIAHCEGYYRDDAVYLVAAPFFHASGNWPMIAITASAGTAVILPGFDAATALAAIARHRCTESLLVPTMVQMLIEHPDFTATDLSSFRTIVYGASPITEALLDRALAALPDTRFIQAYGMTELSPQCVALPHECLSGDYRARGVHRAGGRACYGVEMRIVDEDDKEVPRGQVGEICARGESVMLGYWRRPDETAAALKGGWMHTGDGGRMDAEGFVYVVDRVKDMIVSGGENVYSIEVESALSTHPAVRSCVVIGVPHERWIEQVHAIVILHDGAAAVEADLIDHVRQRLAGFKVPRSVEFRTEPFPLSPANKILKREIRAPYWAGRASSIC